MSFRDDLPEVRGKLLTGEALAPFTWFRVGGPADALFLPADPDDLADFLRRLPAEVRVTVLGVGSNVIVRDGGVEGVVIRLAGRAFAAYGGVYIALALLWQWGVEGHSPDIWDFAGAAVCLAGAAIILFAPR